MYAYKFERYIVKKFKILSCMIAIVGFMCLYAGQTQDQVPTQQSIAIQSADTQIIEHTIQLFMYDGCSYCVKVTDFLKQYNLMDKVVCIDAGIPENRELLRSISGKTQAPYLVDVEAGIKMPESLDIIAYFSKKFNVTMPMAETVMRNVIEVNGLKKYDSVTFLSDVQASQKPVIILISTTWCPPCKVFKPIFLQIAQEFAHVCEFICVDGDANMEIVSQLGIQAYPSIVCYKNGKKINFENYRSQEGLIRLINQLLAR